MILKFVKVESKTQKYVQGFCEKILKDLITFKMVNSFTFIQENYFV